MATTFAKMALKKVPSHAEVKLENGETFNVVQYLPIELKNDLIFATLEKSQNTDGTFNQALLEMWFNLNIVYLYTDIKFTDKQKEREDQIYDILEQHGVIQQIINAIPETEYNKINDMLSEAIEEKLRVNTSAVGFLKAVFSVANTEAIQKVVDEFQSGKYDQIVQLAEDVGINRTPFQLVKKD